MGVTAWDVSQPRSMRNNFKTAIICLNDVLTLVKDHFNIFHRVAFRERNDVRFRGVVTSVVSDIRADDTRPAANDGDNSTIHVIDWPAPVMAADSDLAVGIKGRLSEHA